LIVESERVSEIAWNNALKETPNGTLFQSTHWAEFLKKTFRDKPIYITALDKAGNIQGLLLAIESCYGNSPLINLAGKHGFLFGKFYKHTISPLFHKMLPYILWEKGPVILPQFSTEMHFREALYREMVQEILNIACKRKSYAIKFARPALFDDNPALFSLLGFQKKKMGTILVDLDHPLEFLWKRIDRSARKNIGRIEQDLQVFQMSKFDELKEFHNLHVQSTRRLKMKTYPFSFFKCLWDCFFPKNEIVGFIAFYKGEPIGASISLMYNKMIHEYAYADSDYARLNRIYVIDALKWHIIKWAHDMNFEYFDLSGVQLYKINAGDEKARNIYRFKAKWGGQLIEYHDYKKPFKEKKLARFLSRFLIEGEGEHT